MLGGHSTFIGLGEVANEFAPKGNLSDRRANPTCSCGQQADECPFWGPARANLAAESEASVARRYQIVFDTFEQIFGPAAVAVDSSKTLPRLQMLHRDLKLGLRVLFLIKDVRNHMVSHIDNVARKRQSGSNRTKVTPLGAFRSWYSTNQQMQGYLQRERIPTFQLGYEELCLSPELIGRKICDFMGVDFQPTMLQFKDTRSHVLRGNRMKNQEEKAALAYDHRWFLRRDWILPSLICRRIMQYNREQVYSNGLEEKWQR
jgi:hypothetical protein